MLPDAIYYVSAARIPPSIYPVLWCNGSTQVFGAYSPSSNLGRTTTNNSNSRNK